MTKVYRTLLRVTGIQKDGIWICAPFVNSEMSLLVPTSRIPTGYHKVGERFHAKVKATDMTFEIIEVESPVPNSECHP